jgi:hypothetical protein
VRLILFFIILFSFSLSSYAEEPLPKKTKKLPKKKATETPATEAQASSRFKIRYGSNDWNASSSQIDTAYMFVREKNSQKIAKILMEETEPDSGVFTGQYSINWENTDPNLIEVYIPPKNTRNKESDLKKFNQEVLNNMHSPQPLIVKDSKGVRLLDVYDSQEHLDRAKSAYEEQKKAEAEAEKLKMAQAELLQLKLQESADALRRAELAKLAAEAAEREAERIRLESLEKEKRLQKIEAQKALARAEKEKRQKEAKALSDKGKGHYERGEYSQAADAFKDATDKDPENNTFYFMYGVSLYRLERFDDALVILRMLSEKDEHTLEKDYYIALIHYRKKEFKAAIKAFQDVRLAENKRISPSAAYYQGLCYFALENLMEAKSAFEWVVDTADSPKLAAIAEEYIERVARAIKYKKMQERKWRVLARAGLNYDTNILFTPDNDPTAGTNAFDNGGARLNLQADIEHRFYIRENSNWAARLNTNYIYSADDTFSIVDPWVNAIALPYNLTTTLGKKNVQWQITPGYENILMDFNADGTRESIQNTMFVSNDLNIINNPMWISGYTLEVRAEDSLLASSTGDNDFDSTRISLRTTQTRLLDESKKRAVIGLLGLVLNQAKGSQRSYQRFELGALYSSPFKKLKNASWNAGLNLYQQSFTESSPLREDFNVALNYTFTRAIDETWSFATNAVYMSNVSTLETTQFTKYQVTAFLIYNWIQ